MILTDKTLKHFNEWKINNKQLSTIEVLDFKHLSVISQNALIIEWFDSVGIYILNTDFDGNYFWYEFNGLGYSITSKNRNEALKKTIIKANEQYNNRR